MCRERPGCTAGHPFELQRTFPLHGSPLRERWRAALLGALALFSGPLLASSPADLDFPRALDAAYRNNPDLAAAGWNIGIAEGERRQAAVIPNPELSWEAEDTRSDTRTTTVQISQPIELGGKRGARIEVAERGQDIAALELEQKRNDLRADTIVAFHGALRTQIRVELAEESLRLAERGLSVAEARIRAGKAAPVEALRADVQRSEMRLELGRARTEREAAYQQLAAVMGEAQPGFSRVQGELGGLPPRPAAAVLLGRLDETAELRLAARQVGQQEASLVLEKANRIPDLSISVGSQYSAEDRERVNLVGLSMPIPLFDRNQGNVLAAARRADQARDLRNATELRLRSETRQALEQWSSAAADIRAFEQSILPAAQRAVDSATRGFQMGKFAFLDVLDAQRTLIDSRGRYLQAVAEATDAWAALVRLYGDLSSPAEA
ncbi:TolC family protein [Metapseudomonas resinovorans]|uniref:TolC family protein n=1 Tax=Metapseudomonas resinovorans TaxID=53412 RepID=UPI003B438305